MKYKIQYTSAEDRKLLISLHRDKTIIEEQNITEGNFLVFSVNPIEDTKQINNINVPQEEFNKLEQDNIILKAQTQANSDRADFQEEVITEIIMALYQ